VELEVYKTDGTLSGEKIKLPKEIFDIEPNEHAIYLSIVAEMAHRRQGNAKTKTRGEVSGGGKKPWRQKGRGTARAGSTRSPVWVGGGRAFGPSPRSYHMQVNKKVNLIARKSALSQRAKEEKIKLVEDFTFDTPKTQKILGILNNLELRDSKTLLLVPQNDHNLWLSGRNLPTCSVREARCFSTADVLNAEVLLIQKSALLKISEVLKK
jgi:large subunit ribosomal protein L4